MKTEYIICTFVFILVGVIIIINLTKNTGLFKNKDKFENETGPSTTETGLSTTKVLKYFGGGYCPYSNEQSPAYLVIKDFEKLKQDVKVEYYWTEKNQSEMEQYKIMYVPTILGKNNQQFELKLPDNITKEGKTDEELKNALMDHIYNSL